MDDIGLIEQYKSLREEIMRRQDARTIILGFTITGIGTIIGLALKEPSLQFNEIHYYNLALICFSFLIIIAAVLLTIQHTQQIDTISGYIKIFIEPNVKGIKWESHWSQYRNLSYQCNIKIGGLPLGTSKPLALFYCMLIISVFSLTFATGYHHYLIPMIVISILAIISLSCTFDLYYRKSKSWKINWKAFEQTNLQ